MKRRKFIKLSFATCALVALSSNSSASDVDLSKINFSKDLYESNAAQTIIIYMYGGASQLSGNLTNIDEIKEKSQSNYDNFFRGITKTENSCWQEAGGTHMEEMIANGDMTIFRCSYSKIREENNNKSHGLCTLQNQKGSFDLSRAGIVTNIAQILQSNGVINENTLMPFVTLEGDSKFYSEGDRPLSSYLKAVGLDEKLNNPYKRNARAYYYYTKAERDSAPKTYRNAKTGFDPVLDSGMNSLAQKYNTNAKIKNAFERRSSLSDFIDSIATSSTPDLGVDAYPTNNSFARKIEASIKVMSQNSDTKVLTISAGGWDDHNDARNYVTRAESLFKSLKSAMAHLKAVGKEDTISIMVYGEFGRNVNLNAALGWDHGNLQNLYVLGGKRYFTHRGVVGETILENTGAINRLYLKPKNGTYEFEHLSIAATLYKIFGIKNPEALTNGSAPIDL